MPKERSITVYQFNELADRAKETARDWFRRGDDFNDFHGTNVIDDCARLAALIGIDMRTKRVPLMGGGTRLDPEVYYSGFCSQGDGASFYGSYSYRKGGTAALAAEAPTGPDDDGHKGNNEINAIARELQTLQRRHFYRLQAAIGRSGSRYAHEMTMAIDVERADSVDLDETTIEAVRDCMRDVARWIYRTLEREYEYQNSDAVVDENILANEYEFDEEGNRV